MHKAMFQTLEDVIDYYINPGAFVLSLANVDTTIGVPIGLIKQEKGSCCFFENLNR